jgi:UDP-glucose 4-epimerase
MGAGFEAINIGTGKGSSVFEVLQEVQNTTGFSFDPEIIERRPGDPAALVANVTKAYEVLGWESRFDLKEIVESAWNAWESDRI